MSTFRDLFRKHVLPRDFTDEQLQEITNHLFSADSFTIAGVQNIQAFLSKMIVAYIELRSQGKTKNEDIEELAAGLQGTTHLTTNFLLRESRMLTLMESIRDANMRMYHAELEKHPALAATSLAVARVLSLLVTPDPEREAYLNRDNNKDPSYYFKDGSWMVTSWSKGDTNERRGQSEVPGTEGLRETSQD